MEIQYPFLIESCKTFVNNINSLENRNEKKLFILLTTGAYCPPHFAHLEVFNSARSYVESLDNSNAVIGGLISPSHDQYVTNKLRRLGYSSISANHRLAMVQAACANTSWIRVSDWEANCSSFLDYPEVTKHNRNIVLDILAQFFDNSIKRQIQFVYICGADHAYKCNLYARYQDWCDMIIAISRPGDGINEKILQQKAKWGKSFYLCEGQDQDLSSTKIRELMIKNAPLVDFCCKEVCEYITENKITVKKLVIKLMY